MGTIKEPKYDNDYITKGYLEKKLASSENVIEETISAIPKSYSTPPITPYYKDSLLSYNGKLYKCINTRLMGSFTYDDWKIIATDDSGLNDFIDKTYSTDKIQLEKQIDDKVESWYQETDPAVDWTTDISKAKHSGDYWYDTTTNVQWRYTKYSTNPVTYGWAKVDVPMTLYDKVNSKKSIYTSKPSSYEKDDLWIIEDTLSDDDLPAGEEENPIAKGDWVFAIQSSSVYDKSHWVKRDMDVSMEYLETHYYTKEEVSNTYSSKSYVDSNINKAKDEIELSVSENYTTKNEIQEIVSDYDEQIGTINTTIETQGETLTNLSVENGRISGSVSSLTTKVETIEPKIDTMESDIKNNTTSIANNALEVDKKLENYAPITRVTEVEQTVQTLQTDTQYAINVTKDIKENGVSKVTMEKGFTFDENGLKIDETNSPTSFQADTNAIWVTDKTANSELLFAGYDEELKKSIVRTNNLWVKEYFSIGKSTDGDWRWETINDDTWGDGLGLFYIGGGN